MIRLHLAGHLITLHFVATVFNPYGVQARTLTG